VIYYKVLKMHRFEENVLCKNRKTRFEQLHDLIQKRSHDLLF
jgi:hypothetical protein